MANREVQVFRWDMSVDPRAEIAELFGMNWDAENHIMYHGEDTDNGFDVVMNNSNQSMIFRHLCNGTIVNNNGLNVTNIAGVFYLINDDETVVVFGSSISNLCMGCAKAGDTFIYFASAVSSSSFSGFYGDNVFTNYFRSGNGKLIQNNRAVALAPIVLGLESTAVADDLYVLTTGDQSSYNGAEYFSLDGEDYLIMPSQDSDAVRPVIHLGKS